MVVRTVVAIIAALTGLLVPSGLLAQRGMGANATDTAGMVLRMGQLARNPGEPTEIVSVLPDRFAKDLMPEGAAFLTGSSSPSLVVVVLQVPRDSVVQPWLYQWKLEDSGWINAMPVRFGFVTTSTGGRGGPIGPSGPTLSVCRAGDFAEIGFWKQTDGSQLMRMALGPDPRRGCASRPYGSFTDVPLPYIELPAGLRASDMGGSGGINATETSARFETTAPVKGLAASFVRQLADAGWKLEAPPVEDEVMSVSRLTNRTRAGDPVTAIVTVTMLNGTPFVDAVIRVIRHKPVR